MSDITIADISEFQPSFDADPYLASGHPVIIVRAHNGSRPDHTMPGRRDYVRSKPFTAVGYYQYLLQTIDPVTQARAFITTIGKLAENEFAILDHEEGGGNQTPRAEAWLGVVDEWAGFPSSLYSGSAFLNSQLGGPSRWGRRPLWIASYPNSYRPNPALEPAAADWWQYSDRETFPGLEGGVDGSIFHGDGRQFLEAVRPSSTPTPVPASSEDIAVAVGPTGEFSVFTCDRTGEIWTRSHAPAGWADWRSLGKP